MIDVGRIGKRGTVVIPPRLLQRYGLREGSLLILEEGPRGLTLRRVEEDLVETYTPERKAEFLLQNAADDEDYEEAVAEVRRMGLDPAAIPHDRP
ncbi:MAG: AbrB/MazE/SpoVT family DNA-binding domain-containing protein [Deferrisomatales bacterium]